MDVHRLTDAIRQPEYTGENRCPPCTVVNAALAGLLSAALALAWPPLGLGAFPVALAVIYLRGYLVPGTPALTKRYLPDRVLARFETDEYDRLATEARPETEIEADTGTDGPASPGDATGDASGDATRKESDRPAEPSPAEPSPAEAAPGEHAPATDGAGIDTAASVVGPRPGGNVEPPDIEDPESFLRGVGALEEVPGPAVDDLRLDPECRRDWLDRADALADLDDQEAAFADLLGVDRDRLVVISHGAALVVNLDGSLIGKWESREAFVADIAADRLLAERVAGWTGLPAERRSEVVRGLRAFLETGPGCGGPVELCRETVESCCRSKAVMAATCGDCGARLLEVEAPRDS